MINKISTHKQAVFSAEDYGGTPADYYNLHAFIDSSLVWSNDDRLCILTHNSVVAGISSLRFKQINDVGADQIVKSHIIYEYGHIPYVDSVISMFVEDVPRFDVNRAVDYVVDIKGVEEKTISFLREMFGVYYAVIEDDRAHMAIANTFGIHIIEYLTTAYLREPNNNRVVSVKDICQDFVVGGYGHLPDLKFVLDRMTIKHGQKS